jgi:glycyl-tRNA synthetase beta chain
MEETMGEVLYLEIGSEEIPAGYIAPALEAMAMEMVRFLDENRIGHGAPFTTGTPRRLLLLIPDVAIHQEACSTEIIGPPKQVAFDAGGKPTKAAEGFARGQGVRLEDVQIKETPRGAYLCVVKEEEGLPSQILLEKMLPDFIAHVPFPKSMRWGSLAITFARPVHGIVALLGKDVLHFTYGEVQSGDRSPGHRFMSPGWLQVTDYSSHKDNLKNHFVVVDIEDRKQLIRNGIEEAARKVGGQVLQDDELLNEVTQLVEYPQPLVGEFEDKYLELPPELLITVIKKHQRYFAVTGDQGRLLPYFVTVANTIPRDFNLVAAGNARVVRARLEDARFYYKEDQKVRLEDRAAQLQTVVFHSKLGTSWEKAERFTALARWLGERLAPARVGPLLRAAFLCKADLVTGMVGEFPELQGVMGRAYARLQSEPEAVAEAIYEHYLPVRAGGPIPKGVEGALLSVADKIDTIVGCFGVGLIPTGAADPFALRRQTLGIIRIVLEKPFKLSLSELIDQALIQLASKMTEPRETAKQGVLEFFLGRLTHMLVSQEEYTADVVEAALAAGIDDLVEAVGRAKALAAFKSRPDFESVTGAFKRVANIIKEPEPSAVISDLLQNPTEQSLYTALSDAEKVVDASLVRQDFEAALSAVSQLRGFIDAFFDAVLVMDKDEAIRRNRLALLTRIHVLFGRIADFRRIQTGSSARGTHDAP